MVLAVFQGAILPIFGWFVPKAIFSLNAIDLEVMWDESMFWIAAMAIISIFSGINCYFYKYSFGIVSQGLIKNVRSDTYTRILEKHVGWYDNRDNNAGGLTTLLQSDV